MVYIIPKHRHLLHISEWTKDFMKYTLSDETANLVDSVLQDTVRAPTVLKSSREHFIKYQCSYKSRPLVFCVSNGISMPKALRK